MTGFLRAAEGLLDNAPIRCESMSVFRNSSRARGLRLQGATAQEHHLRVVQGEKSCFLWSIERRH